MTEKFLQAKPVWKEGEERIKNVTCAFYTEFLSSATEAIVRIACCNVYKLYLNGEFVAVGPARAAHGYYRMDELCIPCREGKNVLFIEVTAYNTNNYCYLNAPGFLQAEVCVSGVPVAWTGEHFWVRSYLERLRKVSRYSYQRSFIEAYDFAQNPQEGYLHFRKEYERPCLVAGGEILKRGVSYTRYEQYKGKQTEGGRYAFTKVFPMRNLFTNDMDLGVYPPEEWETYACDMLSGATYQKAPVGELLQKGEYVLYDFSAAQTGYVRIRFSAAEDTVIYGIFDSIDMRDEGADLADIQCFRGNEFNVIEYRVRKGEFEHITMEPYVMRYLKILVVEGGLSKLEVSVMGCENPDAEGFSFVCENEKLLKIVDAGLRTFKANAVDIFTDCPSRERAGWLCDSYFLAKTEQLLTGKNRVERAFLENYRLAPPLAHIPAGMVPMCYPAEFLAKTNNYIPNWAFWYIIELCDNAKREGNDSQARLAREKIDGLLAYFAHYENEDGLLEDLKGWVFVEWSKANDEAFICGVNYPSNMMYARALQAIGEVFGEGRLIKKAALLQEKIVEQSFNGEFFEDNRVRRNGTLHRTGNISETCQYYAFFCGLADKKRYPSLYARLLTSFGSGREEQKVYPHVYKSNAFIGNYLRLSVLLQEGDCAQISKECVDFFYNMAKKTGTLWEHDKFYGSLNHGFASFALNILVAYMTGYRGRRGKMLCFSRCGTREDCEVHLPLENGELIFIRKNGETTVRFPEEYQKIEI